MDVIKSLFPRQLEKIPLFTQDGVDLNGYYAKAEGAKRLFIIIHGLGRSHLATVGRWEAVYPHLGSVLFLDLRGHGLSTRRALITFGDKEALDVRAAVDRFKGEYESIVLWGHSMGAAASLKYAGDGGKPSALILEGMYSSFNNAINVRANLWHIPWKPAVSFVKFFFRYIVQVDFEGLDMPHILRRITDVPILLVHSKEDEKVPMASYEKLKAELGGKSRTLLFEYGNHDSIYRTNREEYIKTVEEFIGSVLS